MTIYKFSNFAASTLQVAIGIADTALVISSADAAKFPVLSGGDAFYMTIWDRVSSPEIVEVTARSGQNLTVIRGVDGTAGTAWHAGTPCRVAMTKALFESIAASSLTTNIVGPVNGEYLQYQGGLWINATITEADVVGLVADLAALAADIASHLHMATDIDSGNPIFTTIEATVAVSLANGYDLNSLSNVGFYKVNTPTNGPGAGNWLVECAEYDASTACQKAVEITGVNAQEYIRRKIGGSWAAWSPLPTDATMNAAIAAAVASGSLPFAVATGTVNAISADFTPDISLAVDGLEIAVRCGAGPNTSTAPTLSPDGGTARTVFDVDGGPLWPGAIDGDHRFRWNLGSTSWRCLNPRFDYELGQGADNANDATITLGPGGQFNLITSAVAITAITFTKDRVGRKAQFRVGVARTLTHNATSLICLSGASIPMAIGDVFEVTSLGGGNVFVSKYEKVDGTALVAPAAPPAGVTGTWTLIQSGSLSGTSLTVALGATYKALKASIVGASASSGINVRVAISDDGTTFGTAIQISPNCGASSDSVDAVADIVNTGVAATTKYVFAIGLPSNTSLPAIKSGSEAAENGITHSIRFSPSSNSFDAGTYAVYGLV